MAARPVICQVRALYSFESDNSSSLSFKAGATIDVYSKMESGWWDGWCEGKRGWFPSNFVELIKERRSSVQSDISEWILETTEDGSGEYYYNTRTQEMRYSLVDSARSSRTQSRLLDNNLSDDEDKLPPDWTRKMTAEGRYYYYNYKTKESTWELELIDPDTGVLMVSQPNSPPSSPKEDISLMVAQTAHALRGCTQSGLSYDTPQIIQCVRLLSTDKIDSDQLSLYQNTLLTAMDRTEPFERIAVEFNKWAEQLIPDLFWTKRASISEPSKDTKATKFFGEDPSMGETPWFLKADYNELLLNMEGHVKGGTLPGLVQKLTGHDQFDAKFNVTFLLTYRSFCSTEELFIELFQRYQILPPEDINDEEVEVWKEKKLKLVRLRVFNIIKSWLETYFNEEQDWAFLPILSQFTDQVISNSMSFGTEQLTKLIKKRMLAEDTGQLRKMKLNVRTDNLPEPILPKNLKRIQLLDLDPHELARQMTMMDFRLYNRIKAVECLDKNWSKGDPHIAANVKALIEHANQVTAWVTDSILTQEEMKKRAAVFKYWVSVVERCRMLNNFNACMAILSAFDNGSIYRLKRTRECINAKSLSSLDQIRLLLSAKRNFREYREMMKRVSPPCIPFLGIYLQDLTFIEDGNSNYLQQNQWINFSKRAKTADVILDLQQYQSTHYLLTVVPDIQEFIKTHLQSSRDDEELYNLSLKLEPRESDEDTLARRLKESGF